MNHKEQYVSLFEGVEIHIRGGNIHTVHVREGLVWNSPFSLLLEHQN